MMAVSQSPRLTCPAAASQCLVQFQSHPGKRFPPRARRRRGQDHDSNDDDWIAILGAERERGSSRGRAGTADAMVALVRDAINSPDLGHVLADLIMRFSWPRPVDVCVLLAFSLVTGARPACAVGSVRAGPPCVMSPFPCHSCSMMQVRRTVSFIAEHSESNHVSASLATMKRHLSAR